MTTAFKSLLSQPALSIQNVEKGEFTWGAKQNKMNVFLCAVPRLSTQI